MKKTVLIALISMSLIASLAKADDHETFTGGLDPNAPINVQVQVCNLNPGKTQAQYDRMVNKYFAWAKKYDVETTFVRLNSFLTHANPNNPNNYDFIELLGSDFETSGKAWDLWMSTPDGQKLNEEWVSLASCDIKMAALNTQWAKIDELNSDDDRIAVWNWCSAKDGVSTEQLIAKHAALAEEYSDGLGNIGWFTFYPIIGGANAAGDFAHITVFPDMKGLMEHQEWFASGGWRARSDYYTYAECQGDQAFVETIMNRPGS